MLHLLTPYHRPVRITTQKRVISAVPRPETVFFAQWHSLLLVKVESGVWY